MLIDAPRLARLIACRCRPARTCLIGDTMCIGLLVHADRFPPFGGAVDGCTPLTLKNCPVGKFIAS